MLKNNKNSHYPVIIRLIYICIHMLLSKHLPVLI